MMDMERKYEIIFIEDAKADYQKLNGSEKQYVDIALAKISYRADELGVNLTKKFNSNLTGCKKIKFKKIGIRIVFRIIGDHAEIVEIIAIGKRRKNEVYNNATRRLSNTK